MTESIYKEYQNKYYNPTDNDKKPGDNDNWKSIQEGFHRIGSTQLETSAGLTLGKGTEDETSVTAAELEEMKKGSESIIAVNGFSITEANCVSLSAFSRDVIPFALNNLDLVKEWMIGTGADYFYLVAPSIYQGLNTKKVRLTPVFNTSDFTITKREISNLTGYSILCDNLTGETVADYYTGSYLFVVAVKQL